MKKILASLAAVAALTGFAGSAFAVGGNASTGGSASAETFNSVHSGSVTPTCSLAVTDGGLGTIGLNNALATPSGSKGKISTVCNSTTSTLKIDIPTSAAAGNIAAAPLAGYKQSFQLSNGGGAYSNVASGFVPTLPGTQITVATNLSSGFSADPSTVDVEAKVEVGSGFVLPAGAYTVTVNATVTP